MAHKVRWIQFEDHKFAVVKSFFCNHVSPFKKKLNNYMLGVDPSQ